MLVILGLIKIAMVWHPMPAKARLPSGRRVDRLWGQPEQKVGTRSVLKLRCESACSFACRKASRAVMPVLMLLNAAALSYFAWRTLA